MERPAPVLVQEGGVASCLVSGQGLTEVPTEAPGLCPVGAPGFLSSVSTRGLGQPRTGASGFRAPTQDAALLRRRPDGPPLPRQDM